MEKFSIDLRASDKGERKKVVRYLRDKGFDVIKRKDDSCTHHNYLFYRLSNSRFEYGHGTSFMNILTLPRDWDRFVGMVGKEKCSEATEEFKAGDWVIVDDYGCVKIYAVPGDSVYEEKTWAAHEHGFFYYKGDRTTWGYFDRGKRKATETEIEEHLLKEARRRGFEVGVKYKSIGSNNDVCELQGAFKYIISVDGLVDSNHRIIYCEGQWAEIIKDKVPEIGGYKLEKANGNFYQFGCKKFSRYTLKALIALKPDYITIEGYKVYLSELESILEYIDK